MKLKAKPSKPKKTKSVKPKSPMPVPKLTKPRDAGALALKRLGVSPEKLASVPQVTPLFKQAEGGLKAVISAMRFATQDEIIGAFLKKYDSVSEDDRKRLPWEAFAISAGVDLRHLAGAIMVAMSEASVSAVKIIALSAHPVVMEKTVEFAKLPGGEKDRTSIHQALGFLPSPKGPTFIGKAVFGSPQSLSGVGKLGKGEDDDDDGDGPSLSTDELIDQLFPSPVKTQEKVVQIRQRLLPGS
jgi:hypothetical protein